MLILVLATLFSIALTPIARVVAMRIGAVDHPGERRIHKIATPRFGGPAIFIAMMLAMICSHRSGNAILVISAVIVMLTGALDDMRPQKPLAKLVTESVAALIVMSGASSGLGSFALGVVFIVAVTNAINLVDGLDGLAAGLSLVIAATLLMLSHGAGVAPILLALCGALLGFLPYNLHPARIFLGDSGALLIGFLLGVAAISSMHTVGAVAPAVALGFPLLELSLTVARRFLRAAPLFGADRDHIHHRMIGFGIGHRAAVALLYICAASFCWIALMLPRIDEMLKIPLLGIVLVACAAGVRMLGYHRELTPLASPLRINATEP